MTPSRLGIFAIAAALGALCVTPGLAQNGASVPNAMQGFSNNRDKPIHINATTLEVRDKERKATFSGAVHVVQGDTTLKSKTLDVYYEQDPATAAGAGGGAMTGGQQQIRRLEAKGGVLITQKEQTATGENGVFDMRSNMITLTGNVVVTQGQNVVRGDRLIVDMTTGVSRIESGRSGEGVRALFLPNSAKEATGSTKESTGSTKEAPKSAPKAAPAGPMKLN
jgi:lipopolysaccharide export system protein LptA